MVFIIDECHRSVSGGGKESGSGMLLTIKNTFPRAVLFGFTGTPIFPQNAHGEMTTEVIFGDMLHKYTLANGIPDGNVLGLTSIARTLSNLMRYVRLWLCVPWVLRALTR